MRGGEPILDLAGAWRAARRERVENGPRHNFNDFPRSSGGSAVLLTVRLTGLSGLLSPNQPQPLATPVLPCLPWLAQPLH